MATLNVVTTTFFNAEGEVVLRRGCLVNGCFAEMVGFPAADRYGLYCEEDDAIYPGEFTDMIDALEQAIGRTPHYMLKKRGMRFDDPEVRLLRLNPDNEDELLDVPLDRFLPDLGLTREEFAERVSAYEAGEEPWDIIFFQRDGHWVEETSR